MFAGFVKGLVSFNQTTKFERARVQATYYADYEAPREEDLQVIFKTLAGKDSETRSSAAFHLIIGKMKASESKKYWNYIVKNLVILDRLVEERIFVKEISELDLPLIEAYDAREKKYKEKMIEELIGNYIRFIKAKAEVYWKKDASLNIPKDQRKKYFKSLEAEDILAEYRVLNALSISAFDIFKTSGHGHLKYKLNQYVFLLVLNSIMNIFSTQYIAFIAIVEKYFEMDIYLANESYQAFKTFLQRTEDLIMFTGNHQFIPGFQISLHELRNPAADAKLLKSMQEYIKLLDENQDSNVDSRRHSIEFDKRELKPKRSEIDIVTNGLKLQSSIQLSEVPGSPTKAGDKTFDLTPQSMIDNDSPPKIARRKALSTAFENTLKIGYHALICVDDGVAEQVMKEYKVIEEETVDGNQEAQQEDQKNGESNEKAADATLTPAFKKLLLNDVEDLVFEAFQNNYSYTPEEPGRLSVRPSRQSRISYELKPVGLVFTQCDNYLKAYEHVEKMDDFKPEIFDSFKNLYSAQFRL